MPDRAHVNEARPRRAIDALIGIHRRVIGLTHWGHGWRHAVRGKKNPRCEPNPHRVRIRSEQDVQTGLDRPWMQAEGDCNG